MKTADPNSPASWNMYAYVTGDPANLTDSTGTSKGCLVNGIPCSSLPDCDSFSKEFGLACDDGTDPCYASYLNPGVVCIFAPISVLHLAPPKAKIPAPDCEDLLTIEISGYLAMHGSPLASLAGQFVSQGANNNVDPRFLVALSRAESTWGESLTAKQGPNNAWSVNTHYYGGYPSFSDALTDIAHTLGTDPRYISGGNITAAGVYDTYNPGYDPDYFTKTIGADMSALGGNLSDVRFPCHDR